MATGTTGCRTGPSGLTHNARMTEETPAMNTPTATPRHRRGILLVVVVVLIALAGAVLASGALSRGPSPVATRIAPLLPDLVMAPIETANAGIQEFTNLPVVRVDATIVNKGAGDFIIAARRAWPWSSDWTVYQQVEEASGGFTEQVTDGGMIFTGAPHTHWHVTDMESHRLERIDTGEVLSEVIKQGFCPFDTEAHFPTLPGAPPSPVFLESDCSGASFVTSMRMGTSVGWGDEYPWHMIEQSIDLTGIPDGTYRIREIADPLDWFEESDETNNETWIDVSIATNGGIPSVEVVGRAP